MKWLKYSTVPIGIFMLVLSLLAPKVQASTIQFNVIFYEDQRVGTTNVLETGVADLHFTNGLDVNGLSTIYVNSSNYYNYIRWYDVNGNSIAINDYRATTTRPTTITVPNNAYTVHFSADDRSSEPARVSFTLFQQLQVSYDNPNPTFTNETAVFNYNMGNAEILVTSPQPTYDTGSITGRGILIGRSDLGFNSPIDVTVDNFLAIDTKTGGYTGDQQVTFTNIQPNVTYYIRSYVQYNNSVHYYSNGISLTTNNFNVRTVDWIDWNGQVVHTEELQVGANITQSDVNATPLGREGYTFNGWTGDTTVGHDFITYERTAVYTQVPQYTVTFVDWDNTFIASGLVTQGESATLPPNPTRTGYRFLYWLPPVSDVQGNITTVAQYVQVFTLTWRDPSFNTLKIETVDSGLTGTPPNYVVDSGFVLTGWSPNPNTPPTQDTQYIAQVSPINPNLPPEDYNPITDLLGGVMGASVGAIMTLGTINLFGIYLYQLIFLFIGTTLTLWILKAVRG